MSKHLTFVTFVTMSLLTFNAIAAPRYLHVIVSGDDKSDNRICEGSLWFEILERQQYGGVYYIAEKACGITSEASRYQSDDLKFELVFNLVLMANSAGNWIGGSTRALSYTDRTSPGRAERSSTEKAIQIGQKLLLASHSLSDGRNVNFYAEITENLPSDCPDCGVSAVTLRSTFSREGKKFSSSSSSRKFLAEAMEFQSSIDAGVAGPGSPQMNYLVMIQMPGALRSITEPTPCQITFQRAYQISSSQSRGEGKDFNVSYNSKNVKEVVLEPGKELRLVFPPDSPAVEGFAIEDTLIILLK